MQQSKFNTKLLSAMIIFLILIAVTAPAIAQDDSKFTHTVYYDIGGKISINRQLGHPCTTGAVKRQSINGYGELTKAETVKIARNIMTVDEVLDWKVPTDALGNLSVVTTLNLCNRPMSVVAEVYQIDDDHELKVGDIINTYHPLVVDGTIKVAAYTDQLWATSITTDPGNMGGFHQEFFAAYGPGPYEKLYGAEDEWGKTIYYEPEYMWEYREGVSYLDRDHKTKGYKRGDYYVGNYFNIEQYAYTTSGSMRRYISMSSPFENTMLEQELNVIGSAEVREAFDLHNLKGGPKAITLAWYELF